MPGWSFDLDSQSTESFARKFCKRQCCSVYRFFKSSFDEIFPNKQGSADDRNLQAKISGDIEMDGSRV